MYENILSNMLGCHIVYQTVLQIGTVLLDLLSAMRS